MAQGALHAAGQGLPESTSPGMGHFPRDIRLLGQAGTRRAAPFLCEFCHAVGDGGIAQLLRPQASGKALLALLGVIAA